MASPDNGIVWPRFVGKAVQLPHARAGVLEGGRPGGHVLPLAPAVCFRPTLLATTASSDKQRQTVMKVEIKEWNAVAAWRWDMPDDDVCGICRNPYDSTCSKCKFPGDECPLRMSV
jgi:hypothetical protein